MFKWSKLSAYRVKKIMECFCLDLSATQTGLLLRMNRNTVNRHYLLLRRAIARDRMERARTMRGVVEVDESYFGPTRVRGRALPARFGRGTNRQPVFGIFERGGEIYTQIIEDCSKPTLQAIIRGRVDPQSVVCSDGWPGYDGLVDVGYDKHIRIYKNKTFKKGPAHINGIEAFWSFTKRRLLKFNGVKANFLLHLKESEWRYNKPLPKLLASLLFILNKKIS